MNTEILTAENIMEDISSVEEKHTPSNGITQNAFDYGVERINDFVEQKTKQLQEERDRAIQCIKISLYWLNEPIMPQTARSIMKRYIDKLNQENEG